VYKVFLHLKKQHIIGPKYIPDTLGLGLSIKTTTATFHERSTNLSPPLLLALSVPPPTPPPPLAVVVVDPA
jgi:hypothetical protein